MPADFEPRIGFRYALKSGSQEITGVVLECDGKSRLVYTWEDGESDQPSIVAWNLSPEDGGTRLTLDHSELPLAKLSISIEAEVNWKSAVTCLGSIMSGHGRPPVPIVYCIDEVLIPVLERAGFRQPELNEAIC